MYSWCSLYPGESGLWLEVIYYDFPIKKAEPTGLCLYYLLIKKQSD